MLRNLLSRRTDWTVLVVSCAVSLSLMLMERHEQARVAWFLQHTVLGPFEAVVGWVERTVGVYWDNQRLRDRLTRLQIEADALRGERIENLRLRELLDLEERHPYNLVASSVVGRSLDRLGGSLTIDKGLSDGVETGRAVLTPDGLVGRVERSTPHQARVLTLLHPDCAVAARIERSRVDGILQWESGGQPTLDLRYVPTQEDVQIGDLVVSSGLGGMFPAGLRVGTVSRVTLAANGLMKDISVRPAVNFRAIEEILVYLPSTVRGSSPAAIFLQPPPAGVDSAAVASQAGAQPSARPATSPTATPAARVADRVPTARAAARAPADSADTSGTLDPSDSSGASGR